MSSSFMSVACSECDHDIEVVVPFGVDEYSSTRTCPNCGNTQRVTMARTL